MKQTNKNIHWNYFLALEKDLETISRYIEFSPKNYQTHSIAIAHLLMASSSEVDVVIKSICNTINSKQDHRNMPSYYPTISNRCPSMFECTVYIPRYGIEITPLHEWTADNTPQWWKDHNLVKHKRDDNFEKATLKNALYSMSALFIATIEYYKINFENYETTKYAIKEVMNSLSPEPSLLRLHQDNYFQALYTV